MPCQVTVLGCRLRVGHLRTESSGENSFRDHNEWRVENNNALEREANINEQMGIYDRLSFSVKAVVITKGRIG